MSVHAYNARALVFIDSSKTFSGRVVTSYLIGQCYDEIWVADSTYYEFDRIIDLCKPNDILKGSRKMEKKIAVIILILICLLGLVSCSGNDPNGSETTTQQIPSETVPAILQQGDGWNLYKNGVLHIETDAGARAWATYSAEHYYQAKWKKEWRSEVVPIIEKIILADGVTILPEHTALNLSGLSEIELPNTVETIEKEAVFVCPNLHELHIPRSVSHISGVPVTGDYETPWELHISVDPQNPWYETTGGMLIEKQTGTLLYAYSTEEEITVPANVKSIIRFAFLSCFQLKTLHVSANCDVDEYAAAVYVNVVKE